MIPAMSVKAKSSGADERTLVDQWRVLARTFSTANCELDRILHERHGIGVSEFEILDRLAEAPENKLRMHEIEESLHLTQSALSRAVARLERESLVERCACPADRRSVFAVITAKGRKLHKQALPTHRSTLSDCLDPGYSKQK